MQITRITTQVQAETLITNYANWRTRFLCLQTLPGIGLIGCLGMLTIDFKAFITNRLYVNGQELQNLIASGTYNRPGTPLLELDAPCEKSSLALRTWSILNLLTGSCLPWIIVSIGLYAIPILLLIAGGLGCCALCLKGMLHELTETQTQLQAELDLHQPPVNPEHPL